MFTVTSAMAAAAARIKSNIEKGITADSILAHDVLMKTQNDLVKVKIPGKLTARFDRDEDKGKTFGQTYKEFTADAILGTQAQRISEGEYNGRLKAAEDVRTSFQGQKNLGESAVEHLLMACVESEDEVCRAWVSKVQSAPTPAPEPEPKPEPKKSTKSKKVADILQK